MNLAFGVLFMWAGAALLYGGVHDLGATTPWAAFTALLEKMTEPADAAATEPDATIGKMRPRYAP